MTTLHKWLVVLTVLCLVACERPVSTTERTLVDLGSADSCDVAVQACLLKQDDVVLQLELEKNIRPLQPFGMQLQVTGLEPQTIDAVFVEFFMEGMEMGVNRYRLLHSAAGWQGDITLPVCVAGRSDWRAEVEVRGKERSYRAAFRFHSSG